MIETVLLVVFIVGLTLNISADYLYFKTKNRHIQEMQNLNKALLDQNRTLKKILFGTTGEIKTMEEEA